VKFESCRKGLGPHCGRSRGADAGWHPKRCRDIFWVAATVWETGSKSLREIGELFGGLDYAAVAQRIRRTKSTYNLIAAWRLITAMLNV